MTNRFRPLFAGLVLFALSALNTPLSITFAQGSLTPPGPPAPTMKTLAQIEPRTPISSLPFTISTPGSYYLTTNLTGVSGSDGIDIKTNDVTLDLGGFTLQGVSGSLAGINILSPATNLAVCNGALDSWGQRGERGNGHNGQFTLLRILGCNTANVAGSGGLSAGDNCIVSTCTASGNNKFAINAVNNCTVKDCTTSANVGSGIIVASNCIVRDCNAGGQNTGISVEGNNNVIIGCSMSSGSYGISGSGNNCTFHRIVPLAGILADGFFLSGTDDVYPLHCEWEQQWHLPQRREQLLRRWLHRLRQQ